MFTMPDYDMIVGKKKFLNCQKPEPWNEGWERWKKDKTRLTNGTEIGNKLFDVILYQQ